MMFDNQYSIHLLQTRSFFKRSCRLFPTSYACCAIPPIWDRSHKKLWL